MRDTGIDWARRRSPAEVGSVRAERYEVLRQLGSGGEGVVVCARDRRHDRLVAVKIRSAEDPEPLLAEARTLLGMRPHPSLPTAREDLFDGHDYLLVTHWVYGAPLDRWARTAAPGQVVRALEQVADALDHLHGDVKPANILVLGTRRGPYRSR